MKNIMNYEKAVEYLFDIPRFAKKTTIEHTKLLLKRLGNPHIKSKVIHVAGTNGKGSVCTYVNEVLLKNNKTTGLFTSPHLIKPNERIKVNGKDISDEVFLEMFKKVFDENEKLVAQGYGPATFFEYILAMALVYFEKCEVEYIILETGLGGLLDQTNALDNQILTIITEIGYDHMEYLGNTLTDIAYQKAGIIKPGVPVVYFAGRPECAQVIEEVAASKESKAYRVSPDMIKILKKKKKCIDFSYEYSYDKYDMLSVRSDALYQMENAALSYTALKLLDDELCIDGCFESLWEGRMEEVCNNVYLDGGHNEDGIEAFIETVKTFGGKKVLLYSSVSDKEYKRIIERITKEDIFEKYYVTKINNQRGISAKELEKEFERWTKRPVYAGEDIGLMFEKAYKEKGDAVLFCVGSLYLVGSIKAIIEEQKYD